MVEAGQYDPGAIQKKLAGRLENPHVSSAALSVMPGCYKIKLQKTGCWMVYRVDDDIAFGTVVAVDKRNKLKVYRSANERI